MKTGIMIIIFLISGVTFAQEPSEAGVDVPDNILLIPDFLKTDLEEATDDTDKTPKEKHQYSADSKVLPLLDAKESKEQEIAGAKYQSQQEIYITPESQYEKKDEEIKETAPEEPSSEVIN